MEKLGQLMVRNPGATMVALSVTVGFIASRVYKIGLLTGHARQLLGENARAASEALGG